MKNEAMLPQNSKSGYVYKIPIQDNAYGKMLVLKHKNCHDKIDTKWLSDGHYYR